MCKKNFIRPPDLSRLSLDELLALIDEVCTDEQIRQLSLFASAYNAWQMAQPQQMHRRTLHPQMAAHRYLPGKQVRR